MLRVRCTVVRVCLGSWIRRGPRLTEAQICTYLTPILTTELANVAGTGHSGITLMPM